MILTVTLNAAIDKRYVISSFREGEVNRVRECVYTPGGKGVNVSKAAALMGAEVLATGFTGGHSGYYISEALETFGVRSRFCHLHDESRSCINIWDEEKKLQTEFLEPGFTVKEEELAHFLELYFDKLVGEAAVVSISGSVPKGLDGTAYQKIICSAKEKGKPVILDTSGKLLRKGIQEKPTMIKPNMDEIRMLTGKECETQETLIEAAKEIYAQGIEIVVLSLGAEGSLMVCKDGVFRAQVPKINAVNTVGCGDAMVAGFAVGIERKLSLPETLRLASSMSVAAALREETGFFVRKDQEEIYKDISVECV